MAERDLDLIHRDSAINCGTAVFSIDSRAMRLHYLAFFFCHSPRERVMQRQRQTRSRERAACLRRTRSDSGISGGHLSAPGKV